MNTAYNKKPIAIVKASYSSQGNIERRNEESIAKEDNFKTMKGTFISRAEYRPISFQPQKKETKSPPKKTIDTNPSPPARQHHEHYNHQKQTGKQNHVAQNFVYETHKTNENNPTPTQHNNVTTNGYSDIDTGMKIISDEFGNVIRRTDPKIEASLATNEPFDFEQYGYPFGARDRYYFLDSDLETITEESSVLDSDMESVISKRRAQRQSSESTSTLSSHPTLTSVTSEEDVISRSSTTPSSIFERQIDPTAQQRIVYAKCLSPPQQKTKNAAKKTHRPVTDMFEATRNGDINTLKFFSNELSNTVDEEGNGVFHIAMKTGNLPCVKFIAKSIPSAAISLLNDDLVTPAGLAAQHGHLMCLQWAVGNTCAKEELTVSKKQASVDGANMRLPLIHIAVKYNQEDVLTWLCECMSNENYSIDMADQHSNTAVHEAAKYGHLECLQTLVGRGASVTVLNSQGDTPCRIADRHGHVTCVGYLVVVETCVSLAQQIVALKTDMEKMEKKNKDLENQMEASKKKNNIQSLNENNIMRSPITPRNKQPPQYHSIHSTPKSPTSPKGYSKTTTTIVNSPQATPTTRTHYHKSEVKTNVEIHKSPPTSTANTNKKLEKNRKVATFSAFGRVQQTVTTKNQQENNTSSINIKSKSKSNNSSLLTKFIDSNKSKYKKIQTKSSPREVVEEKRHETKIDQSDDAKSEASTSSSTSTIKSQTFNKQQEEVVADVHVEQIDNKEITEINNNRHPEAKRSFWASNKAKRYSKRYDRLSLDEMIRAARDTRHLPSPTVSMCTEDSTMETVEVMRERLAEASRWFMVQQSRAPGVPINRK